MKKFIFATVLFLISVAAHSQQLTGDQIAAIKDSPVFINRVKATLLQKAVYWKESATPARADVNKRMQKRKRMAVTLLSTSYSETVAQQAALYWLAYYQTGSPSLDVNGIPNYQAIFDNFDPTFDKFAGVLTGDETITDIEW